MVPVVLPPKLPLRRPSKFGRAEERLALFAVTPKPLCAIAISRLESPGEVFNLHNLSEERRRSVVATIGEEVGARRHKLCRYEV